MSFSKDAQSLAILGWFFFQKLSRQAQVKYFFHAVTARQEVYILPGYNVNDILVKKKKSRTRLSKTELPIGK